MNFKIKKELLSPEDLKKLQEKVSTSVFPWFYKPSLTKGKRPDGALFQHYLYLDSRPSSQYFNIVEDYFKKHLDYKALVLARINFNLSQAKIIQSRFHTDEPYSCKTAIFYINTTNAITLFKNGKKVESKENTLVMFDSMLAHKVQFNTDGKQRYVINFNYF